MDVYCPRCGEPFDIEEFHDVAAYEETSFDAVRKQFRAEGCCVFGGAPCEVQPNSVRAMASALLMDVSGDDIDGVAADLEDFEFLGMLD